MTTTSRVLNLRGLGGVLPEGAEYIRRRAGKRHRAASVMKPRDVIKFQKALALAACASNPFEAEAAKLAVRRLMETRNIDPTRVPDASFVSHVNFANNAFLKQLRDEYRAQHPPKRIRWRANTVLVTRPSRWGNPFVVRPDLAPETIIEGRYIAVPTAEEAVRRFREETMTPDRREDAKRELRGKDLACDCKLDQPCHADVLIEIANS